MIIPVKTQNGGYDIHLGGGLLNQVDTLLNLDRKVLIVTDSGVPMEYSLKVKEKCKYPVLITIEQGEASKNLDNFTLLLAALTENGFTRTDCVVAVGGGVVGDLSGFAAACFMRGIDFYNIPTTVLSQVDSSIGGKTAIDFMGVKNIVGAFYPPRAVVIDTDTLKTLPKRQISNGLSESVKMALTFDEELFELFEGGKVEENLELIIEKSLEIKKYVVECDEKESGLRRVLNFGHTIGHAIEAASNGEFYHGECVAMGMLPMCSNEVKERLVKVLKHLNLPIKAKICRQEMIDLISHDKKLSGEDINVITVEKVGSFKIERLKFTQFCDSLGEVSD